MKDDGGKLLKKYEHSVESKVNIDELCFNSICCPKFRMTWLLSLGYKIQMLKKYKSKDEEIITGRGLEARWKLHMILDPWWE